jgi:TrmH family RNA methyltransferase
VLAAATVVSSVTEAVANCGFVAATTSRERDQNFRILDVRDAAVRAVQETARGSVAILFGAERTGLTNEDLALAHALIRIPANPAYASLNIAMAVQLVAYELHRAAGAQYVQPEQLVPRATGEEMERLYEHLADVLELIEFRDRTQNGTVLMQRIRRFLQRAELDKNEANILRGILTAVQLRRRVAGAGNRRDE